METALWAKAHGAFTHFPLAFSLGSFACDALGYILGPRPAAAPLHAAGYWMIVLGAAGSIPAVGSGLYMTRGTLLGHGALRLHHLYAWPAFGLLLTLAVGRVLMRNRATRREFTIYLLGSAAAVALVSAAGYWGGEMMLAG